MRQFIAALFVGTVLFAAGCTNWMHRGGAVAENSPTGEQVPATAQDLVKYLNDCSARLSSVKSDGLYMDCKARGQSVGLIANMVCEKPRNFRLRGVIAGQAECDIGSNNEEFWYWIKRDDPPYLYHCSYDAMSRGDVRLPFPFQPDLMVAALGMATYDPDPNKYEVKVLPRTIELSENSVSVQGKSVRKVTVFARAKVSESDLLKGRPQVVEFTLRDAQGQDICRATVEKVVYEHSAIVPQKVKLSWPAEKMELALTLNRVEVNTVDRQLAQVAFNRGDLPYKPFDLARRALDASSMSIQPAGGRLP